MTSADTFGDPLDVVLLTGAPASGKSTLAAALAERIRPLKTVRFADPLLDMKRQEYPSLSHEGLRSRSAQIVSALDISKLDTLLADRVAVWRTETNILIDSHGVTYERFGIRVTPFALEILKRLSLSAIVVLHCPPNELCRRTERYAQGRQRRSPVEIRRLQQMQAHAALTYSIISGCPLFELNSNASVDELLDQALSALQGSGVFLRSS